MSIACSYCIASKGLTLRSSHLFETDEELIEHIEMEHDMPVAREGETQEQTMARFKAKNPRAGGPECQCPSCLRGRGSPLADIYTLVDQIRGSR